MPVSTSKLFHIKVSESRMEATLNLVGELPSPPMTTQALAAEVASLNQNLILDKDVTHQYEKFTTEMAQNQRPEPVVIAHGTPVIHDEHGTVETLYDQVAVSPETPVTGAAPDGGHQSHYDRSCFIVVRKDQPLLKVLPIRPGKDGVDVYGKPISRKLGREAKVVVGANTRREGDTVYANLGGKLDHVGDKISINPKMEINGNIDFSTGNINFPGEVVISKNVLDLFKVISEDNVTVQNMVEAAEVHAGKTLHVVGGMAGKEKGKFSAGENIISKYITNAHVRAGGNVSARVEIVNCDLICGGKIEVEGGPLVGGHIIARGGAKVKDLGSDAGTKTLLEVGVDGDLRQKVMDMGVQIKQRQHKVNKVRQAVEPLMANQKYLTRDQKEKATELLYTASELEEGINAMIEELRTTYEAAKEKMVMEIEVKGTAYPGTTIRSPMRETIVTKEIKGPIKIACQHDRIAILGSDGGVQRELPSSQNPDEAWELLYKLLGLTAKGECTAGKKKPAPAPASTPAPAKK